MNTSKLIDYSHIFSLQKQSIFTVWYGYFYLMDLKTSSITVCYKEPGSVCVSQGKFIRIHFGPTGRLASADIDMCESH